MTYPALKAAVGARASRGEPLDAIGADLIEPNVLSQGQKSALWRHGWVCRQESILRYDRRQRQARRITAQAATSSPAALRSYLG